MAQPGGTIVTLTAPALVRAEFKAHVHVQGAGGALRPVDVPVLVKPGVAIELDERFAQFPGKRLAGWLACFMLQTMHETMASGWGSAIMVNQ